MIDRIKAAWKILTYREHNKPDFLMASALKSGRVKSPDDDRYTNISDDSLVEEMRDFCLREHVDSVTGCPFPDICCHTGAINSFFDSVRIQGEELARLRRGEK